jgi:hypothetical protein
MAIYNKKNETIGLSLLNQSAESPNIFQIIYHSIKDLIEASEHDILTITGKTSS